MRGVDTTGITASGSASATSSESSAADSQRSSVVDLVPQILVVHVIAAHANVLDDIATALEHLEAVHILRQHMRRGPHGLLHLRYIGLLQHRGQTVGPMSGEEVRSVEYSSLPQLFLGINGVVSCDIQSFHPADNPTLARALLAAPTAELTVPHHITLGHGGGAGGGGAGSGGGGSGGD